MTSHPIDPPRRGDHFRASWGASVAERVNECADAIDGMRGPGALVSNREPVTSAVAPFTVRYDAENELWLVFLPHGCMNVGDTCTTINENADGFWYSFAIDESQGTTSEDSDGNTYREWTVTAHAKTSAKVHGVDDLNAPARRLLFVGAQDRLNTSPTDAQRYRDTPGDAFSCTIATVRVTTVDEDGTARTVRHVTQLRKSVVDVGDVPSPTGFDLVWYFSVEDGELSVENVYCVRQVAAVAGMSITGDQMTDVTDADAVYCKLTSPGIGDYQTQLAEVVADPQSMDATDYTVTWLPLYNLTENTVTGDYREASLQNVQIYRA